MKYYRLLSMVPRLPDAPEPPPIPLARLLELYAVDVAEADAPLVKSLLGFVDCRNVEAVFQGHDVFDERGSLSREAIDERDELPEYLSAFLEEYDAGALTDAYPFDALWRAFFQHLLETAEHSRSIFLEEWAAYEIGLRDALARQRADALGEKGDTRTSGVALDPGEGYATLLSTLGEASDPMERERMLDAARLGKIEAVTGIDPFSTDAALAYLASVLVLDRWDIGAEADVENMLEEFA